MEKNAHAIYEGRYVVETLAGNGEGSFRDGCKSDARFHSPLSVGYCSEDFLYVADCHNCRVRVIRLSDKMVVTFGTSPFVYLRGLRVASSGTIVVTDMRGKRVLAISPDGITVQTAAALYHDGSIVCEPPYATLRDSALASVQSTAVVNDVAVDANGVLVVADAGLVCWRSEGKTLPRTLSATRAFTAEMLEMGRKGDDCPLRQEDFAVPTGVAVAPNGDIFFTDCANDRIRKVDAATGVVSTVAGSRERGWRDGHVMSAQFNLPAALAIDSLGRICVADSGNQCIRCVDPTRGWVTTIAGTGECGLADGSGNEAKFWRPLGIDCGRNGVIYVADTDNNAIRSITEDFDVPVPSSVLKDIMNHLAPSLKGQIVEQFAKQKESAKRKGEDDMKWKAAVEGMQRKTEDEMRKAENNRQKAENEKRKLEEDKQKALADCAKAMDSKRKAENGRRKAEADTLKAVAEWAKSMDDKRIAEDDRRKAEDDKRKSDEDKRKALVDCAKSMEDKRKAEDDKRRAEDDKRKLEDDFRKALDDYRKALDDRLEAENDKRKAEEDKRIAEERKCALCQQRQRNVGRPVAVPLLCFFFPFFVVASPLCTFFAQKKRNQRTKKRADCVHTKSVS
eukprot:GEMP01027959.1.p1 GENE.GEMP01027959.1~~GEMP01027959.1.p1  ORF type:complete len:621 (+),score=188.14 GEMP01027959.1:242-2104(+)